MQEQEELFQEAKYLGISAILLALASESGFLHLIPLLTTPGWKRFVGKKICLPINDPVVISIFIALGLSTFFYFFLLYLSMRKIGKAMNNFSFSTYVCASALAFPFLLISSILRGIAFKSLGRHLKAIYFTIAGYIYLFISLYSFVIFIVKLNKHDFIISFPAGDTITHFLSLLASAFLLLGFLNLTESFKTLGYNGIMHE